MASLQEITDLFSRLALQVGTLNNQQHQEQDSSLELSLSSLNQSLNLTEVPRARVLDTALSLMCFKAPQVFNSLIEYLLSTIVSVLSSSVNCRVLRFDKEEVLQIGSSISGTGCVELIEVLNNSIPTLERHGMDFHLLLRAVMRVAVSAHCRKYLVPSMRVCDVNSLCGRSTDFSKLLGYLPTEFPLKNREIPLRLSLWYLDPPTLKHDISRILQDAIKRPFLCLSKEFYDRIDWREILLCLVLSPVMFIDTRALLHEWFLLTGLTCILELVIGLVSMILDVISRPTWWGMSLELGSKLSFSNAYFPYENQVLRILAGPVSYESFIQLVHESSDPVCSLKRQFQDDIRASSLKAQSIDHKSIWALAISFPDWFHFASVSLFADKSFLEGSQSETATQRPKAGRRHGMEAPSAAAARYIAWILSPDDKSQQDLLYDNLTKISESWFLKQINSVSCAKGTSGYRKKLKKPRFGESSEDIVHGNDYGDKLIGLWLKKYQIIMKYDYNPIDKSASCDGNSCVSIPQHDKLLRRIPLGIIIGCPSFSNENGCQLLLHHAATGRVLHSLEAKNVSFKQVNQNSEGPDSQVIGSNECHRNEAVAGARLVFCLTDSVESMSASLFKTEESVLDTICRVKLRVGGYLFRCINTLIQHSIDGDGVLMLMDLHDRLERWKHQGQEVLQLHNDVDDALKGLKHKLFQCEKTLSKS